MGRLQGGQEVRLVGSSRPNLCAGPLNALVRALLVGFVVAAVAVSCSGSSVNTTGDGELRITPNLELARETGFGRLAGHPPFSVDFGVEGDGDDSRGEDVVSYSWDFDGDGSEDSGEASPRYTYGSPGEYEATLEVERANGTRERDAQRIVVIGEPDWPDWRFGVTSHLNRAHNLYANDGEVERAAGRIAELGVDVVRLDMNWSAVQPDDADSYDWRDYDYLLNLSEESGFDLFPVLGYSSTWSSSAGFFTSDPESVFYPPDIGEYAWFSYQAASRYGDRIRAWQVWNEPNNEYFMLPSPDADIYGEMLRESYLAIKYADPDSVVVMGGLANDTSHSLPPADFLESLYEGGGRSYFDAAARHPYTTTAEGSPALRSRLTEVRGVMAKNGDADKPLWITEFGSTALPGDAIEYRQQAELLPASLDAIGGVPGTGAAFWYSFRDTGADPGIREYHYGLLNWDFSPKPSYEAYRDYIARSE